MISVKKLRKKNIGYSVFKRCIFEKTIFLTRKLKRLDHFVITKPDTKPDTNVTAAGSKINIVPALCDDPGSISLAWGTLASKLKPAP